MELNFLFFIYINNMIQGTKKIKNQVKVWLWVGFILVLIQILIGGVTRLTGSGLSITKWEIVTGTLPPLNADQWLVEFDKYRDTPQYQKINKGMTMDEFKFIYFWEYFHRLWARLMGFVFIIPAVLFWIRGYFPGWLKIRVVMIFVLAALVATFGWIMVASGLIDRPWVNAYRLSLHLSLAVILLAYILWTILKTYNFKTFPHDRMWRMSVLFNAFIFIQIFLGGMVSGMRAALLYPTFPKMKGEWIPSIIFERGMWNVENFVQYEVSPFFPALIHTVHRFWAYFLILFIGIYFYRLKDIFSTPFLRNSQYLILGLFITQILLGIITVLNSSGTVPVLWGVSHQVVGVLLFNASLLLTFAFKKG